VRFRDFDIGLSPAYFPEPRSANLRYCAFVEADVAGLSDRRLEAPWIKLHVTLVARDRPPTFMPALPRAGLSVADVSMDLPDPALLKAEGEAVRPVLARAVGSTRDLVRERSGWDDEGFWASIADAGRHRGRYERRVLPTRDRRTGVVHSLTYEWYEAGTTVFVDARRAIDDAERIGRSTLYEFPGQWELALVAGFAPRRQRLAAGRVEVYDRAGTLLGAAPAHA
jgi:hypothetical protein